MTKKTIFDKKNILVAGGAGFIGSHLCDDLVQVNKVICLDNFITGDEDNISHLYQNPDFEFIKHDMIKPVNLEKAPALEGFKIPFQGLQEIYFLASPTSPKAYSEHPIETLLANSIGLKNALDLAVKYKAKLLYVSSPSIYGENILKGLVKEDYIGAVNHLGSRACYAEAKRFGETLVNNYRNKHDLDTKIVRIFNCYGPRMKLDDGRMIPEMIKAATDNVDVIIHGDKNAVGAYFYIDDLIKALVKMMSTAEAGPINIGSESQIKFVDIANKIIQLAGSTSKIVFKDTEEWMAPQILPNITQAKEKLGWFPITLIDDGLKKTIDFMGAHQDELTPEQFSS